MADCHSIIGNYQQSSKIYKKILPNFENDEQVQLNAASVFTTTEEYPLAINIYAKIFAKDTANAYIARCLAKCYDNIKDIPQAINFYKRTVALNPSDLLSANRLCNIYIEQNKLDSALAVTESYRKIDSTNQRINSTNAYIYFLKKNYPEANTRFSQCYANNDSSFFTMKYFGISLFTEQKYDEAKQVLETAYRQDTTDFQAINYLALACYHANYRALSIHYFQKAIQAIYPDSTVLSNVYFNLGHAINSYTKVDCKDAYKAYLNAYQLNPANGEALLSLATCTDECMKNSKQALEYYKIFIKQFPNTSNPNEPNLVTNQTYTMITNRVKYLENQKDKSNK